MNGDGSEAERGRTRPISGSLHPVWKNPAEVFILTAVEEIVLEVRGERENARAPAGAGDGNAHYYIPDTRVPEPNISDSSPHLRGIGLKYIGQLSSVKGHRTQIYRIPSQLRGIGAEDIG